MLLRHSPLTANELRQCLRIATGATLGFTICKLFDLQYGVFFTVFPMLLLGLVPVMNGHVMRQLLASAVLTGLEVGIIGGLFGRHPGLMLPIVFVLFLYRFAAMSKGSLFLFGATGVMSLSIMLHFASYPGTNINEIIFNNFWAAVCAGIIAFLMTAIWPDVTPRLATAPLNKNPNRIRHETLLGTCIATAAFILFQVLDLRDSLSAQATMLLLLFPMHWSGSLASARKRAIGTIFGVSFGMLVQLLLYDWYNLLMLILPIFWLGVMLFAHIHVKEASGSGVGFGAMATLGILFGQYLSPNHDFLYSALYRFSSTITAIIATLFLCYLVHRLLNRFQATRFGN
jgi:hypothetical protein